jgi:predicted aldo/keto reductase-like oxidoreductase
MGKRLMGRRDFMKSSMAGLGSFVYLSANEKKPETGRGERKVIYRTLGKSGIKIPVIGMGMIQASNPALVRAALDAGITHFDSTGMPAVQESNLKMFAEVTRGRPRESFVIGVKVPFPTDPATGLYKEEVTTEAFLKKFDFSLKCLNMEYVDVVYHYAVPRKETAFYEPIMKAMEKAKKDGKTRFLGISTHMNMPEVIQAAIDSNFYEVVIAAYNFRQKNQLEVKEAIARASRAGLGCIGIKAIRGGVEEKEPPSSTNAVAALKWVLQDSNVSATIPGFSTFEQMNLDLSVMEDLSFTDSEKEYIQKQAFIPGLYCQGCGKCVKRCIAKLPIPDLMRVYMYCYGYRNLPLAQETILELGLPRHVCEDYGQCPVKCTNGWNVSEKIREVSRLRDVPSGVPKNQTT